jgi:quercetin 2,3-dioxygenase
MTEATGTLQIRRAAERGRTDWGWLDSRHTFSFGDYHDPRHMGFRALRVINDDRVRGGEGFGAHAHQDMEILSYVLEGALEHRDSLGTGSVIRPGEIQMMRAGTGVRHSEFNHSKDQPVHFLQIWILPDRRGLEPVYAQQSFDRGAAGSAFVLLASKDGREGSVQVSQDVDLWVTLLRPGQRRTMELRRGRHAWVHVATGTIVLDGTTLAVGDAAAVAGPAALSLEGGEAEVLVFDLA